MKNYKSRGRAIRLSGAEAVKTGLSRDGGLLMESTGVYEEMDYLSGWYHQISEN